MNQLFHSSKDRQQQFWRDEKKERKEKKDPSH